MRRGSLQPVNSLMRLLQRQIYIYIKKRQNTVDIFLHLCMDSFNRHLFGLLLSAQGMKNTIKPPLPTAFLECSSNFEAERRSDYGLWHIWFML